ncbi:phosphatase PAP2 family protein [Sulfurovum sp. NBC37-1]|uniref:phosphatase PAP2 family protein n=1 Tax=Sulfurovum sp. (strain NBC37-1) TaxID=387093 RepID=UPI000158761E|nr:phosphatase PAP2 family protein [Sulfurovum sp. NBC37-1]BAF71244.1 conserved hypothetical protein [Sulfurovum sp. NBC37-1]
MKRYKRDLLKAHPRSVFFSVAGLVVFLLMFVNVLTDGPMLKVDEWVSLHVSELHTETGTKMIVFLTDLNGVVASTILFVLISTFLWYKKRYGDLRFFLFSFLGATLLFNLFKFTVRRARPDTSLFELATYSFPSGHTTMATVLALALYVVFVKRIDAGVPRALLLLLCILWPVMIAFTRVYLNVHWFSDVIAGLSLGLFWVTLSTMVYPPYSVRK